MTIFAFKFEQIKTMAKTDYHIFVENGKVGLKDATDRVVLFAVYDGIVMTFSVSKTY